MESENSLENEVEQFHSSLYIFVLAEEVRVVLGKRLRTAQHSYHRLHLASARNPRGNRLSRLLVIIFLRFLRYSAHADQHLHLLLLLGHEPHIIDPAVLHFQHLGSGSYSLVFRPLVDELVADASHESRGFSCTTNRSGRSDFAYDRSSGSARTTFSWSPTRMTNTAEWSSIWPKGCSKKRSTRLWWSSFPICSLSSALCTRLYSKTFIRCPPDPLCPTSTRRAEKDSWSTASYSLLRRSVAD